MDEAKHKISLEIDKMMKYSVHNTIVTSCRAKLHSKICKDIYSNLRTIIPDSEPIYITVNDDILFYFEKSLPVSVYVPKVIIRNTFFDMFGHDLDDGHDF